MDFHNELLYLFSVKKCTGVAKATPVHFYGKLVLHAHHRHCWFRRLMRPKGAWSGFTPSGVKPLGRFSVPAATRTRFVARRYCDILTKVRVRVPRSKLSYTSQPIVEGIFNKQLRKNANFNLWYVYSGGNLCYHVITVKKLFNWILMKDVIIWNIR